MNFDSISRERRFLGAILEQAFVAGIAVCLLATVLLPMGYGQLGDRKDKPGIVQEALWKEMDVPPAPVLSPEEALRSISVADGFEVQLVASEPLVNDPVAIAWDPEGRIWALEMWGYMPDVDGTGATEGPPRGRVVVLEDLDEDGVMDRSTVFLDGLNMPRAITFVEGGVLIGDPPTLWYCQDMDGDLRCDEKRIVSEYAAKGSVEHSENGLLRNLDNWIYNSDSDRRMRFIDGKIVTETTYERGQWGLAIDDYGRIYHNNNSKWLYSDYYPWEYVSGNSGFEPRAGFGQLVTSNMSVFTFRINPGVNRGYRDGQLREDNRLNTITAVCGPSIYRGKTYPEAFHGNAFVPEPSGNAVARFALLDQDVAVFAKHQLEPHPKWGKTEFLGSTDERFRPVSSYTGPDGNLYLVDMYRGILQHKLFVTTFLRKQILERGLDKPVGLGRIYRVVHKSNPGPFPNLQLSDLPDSELAKLIDHENGWQRDTAQRLLVERRPSDPATLEVLRGIVLSGSVPGKLQALWTLSGIGKLELDMASAALNDPSDWVRVHALRVAGTLSQHENALQSMIEQAVFDHSFRVRLQAYQSLVGLEDSNYVAVRFLDALEEDWNSPHFRDTALSSLSGHEAEFVVGLKSSETVKTNEGMLVAVGDLAKALFVKGDERMLSHVLENLALVSRQNEIDMAFLGSLATASQRKGAVPLTTEEQPAVIERIEKWDTPEAKTLAAGLRKAFRRPGDPLEASLLSQLTNQELAFAARGKAIYASTCLACHGEDGRGKVGLAPSLDGSSWVLESKERLALIVAHGLMGPIEVNGEKWNSVMPGHGQNPILVEDALATVLSYIRTAWTNDGDIVKPSELEAFLAPYSDRELPWTPDQLADAGTGNEAN